MEQDGPAAEETQKKLEELEKEMWEKECKHETSLTHLSSEINNSHPRLEQVVLKLQDYSSLEEGKKVLEEMWSSRMADCKKSLKFKHLS
ncbi:UNVERIFIED_CONTAM: hypothetical protein Slati_3421500 [Sesamum latifolium]|uniref:Uncharacterized protein n=1 Tax=Sesamum latifolium TaxID=2727402 RepID=A0AAW2UET1_9LAMI